MGWWDDLFGGSQQQPDPTIARPSQPLPARFARPFYPPVATPPPVSMAGGGVNNPSPLQQPPPPLQSPLDPVNQSASAIVPPPIPGVTVNTNPVIGQSIGPQAAIDAAPYPYSGQAPAAKGMTPSQVGQKVGGRTTVGGTADTGGLNNSDGSVNKGAGGPSAQFSNWGGGSLNKGFTGTDTAAAAPATDGSINKGDGAPAPSGPQSIFGQTKADLGAGSYGKAFGDIFGNDKLMGGVAGLAGALRGGSQGSGATALPPPPNLTDNSASIAQQAPQLLAQTMAKRRKTPGLSLSGINRGFGG